MIKTIIFSILGLTLTPILLILLGVIKKKSFKSCGESCECLDEEMLGY